MAHFDLPKITARSYIFLNNMGGAAARAVITALKQLQQHHMYSERSAIKGSVSLHSQPTSRTDANPAASAVGGLELAETRSLLHVG